MRTGSTDHFGVIEGEPGGPANIDLHRTRGRLQLFQGKHKVEVTPAMAVDLIDMLGQYIAAPVLEPKGSKPS